MICSNTFYLEVLKNFTKKEGQSLRNSFIGFRITWWLTVYSYRTFGRSTKAGMQALSFPSPK